MSKTIGIDLGTYNSTAAVAFGREQVIIVESRHGKTPYGKNFPSFVLFDHNGRKQTTGRLAKAELAINPKLVIWGVKRLVGLSYETAEKRGELKRFQYNMEKGPGGSILIKVGEERFTPSHIIEYILREIKEDAENPNVNPMLGGAIERAVISVPAYFDGTRVGPVIDAAKNAGFKEIQTISEPTAAALVYGLKLAREATTLTFDLGAGTLDVAIMLILNEGGELISGELCTSGHEALGGIDMDDMILSYIIRKYKLLGIEDDHRSIAILKDEVEKAKIRLSSRETAPLDLPHGESVELTRKELEDVLKPLLEKCRGPIRVALDEAGLQANQLDHVLFVGGPTYMPCVRSTVTDELKRLGAREDLLQELEIWEQTSLPVNPMECVARGASLKAGEFIDISGKTDPNGYGTILRPVPGLPDYFHSIIPPNSNYSITRTTGIVYSNSEALRVPVDLVKKLKYDEGGHIVYKYYHLGSYDFYIKSTDEYPEVDITMELNDNKELITTFTHKQTRESVKFEKLDMLKGSEITLQEINPPPHRPGGSRVSGGHRRDWTQGQLDKAVHVSRMLVDEFAERSQDNKVKEKKTELLNLIKTVKDLNDTRFIMRRIQELLNALKNANEISEEDFLGNLEKLREIEKLRD
jgi:molecular chaperone DnaK (HSP70)